MNTKHPLPPIGLVLALGLSALPACRTRARTAYESRQSDSLHLGIHSQISGTQSLGRLSYLRADSIRLNLGSDLLAEGDPLGTSLRAFYDTALSSAFVADASLATARPTAGLQKLRPLLGKGSGTGSAQELDATVRPTAGAQSTHPTSLVQTADLQPSATLSLYGLELGQWTQTQAETQQSTSHLLTHQQQDQVSQPASSTHPTKALTALRALGRTLGIVSLLILISLCIFRIQSLVTALRRLAKWVRTPSLAL